MVSAVNTSTQAVVELPQVVKNEGSENLQTTSPQKEEAPSPLSSLLQIIQNSNLSATEKNIAFVKALTKTTLTVFQKSIMADEFSINNFTFRISGAPNDMTANAERDTHLTQNSYPIYVTPLSQQKLDFSTTELPKALQDEMSNDTLLKEKAKIERIRTLQDLIHGTACRYESVQIEGAIPALSSHQYSLVTFVPVSSDAENVSASWTPFFKSEPNMKLMVTYGNVQDDQDARGGASAYKTNAHFTPIFDSPVTQRGWEAKVFSSQDTTEAAFEKTMSGAVRLAIVPLKTSENKKTYQIEAERTTACEIRPIPIDVSQLSSQESLEEYLQVIGEIFRKVAQLEVEKTERAPQNANELTQKNVAELTSSTTETIQTSTPQKSTESVLDTVKANAEAVAIQAADKLKKEVEWHKNFWGSLFTKKK